MSNLDTITLLNRLIVTTKNGEAALRAAASEVHHAELQESLEEYSRFFADAARELQASVEARAASRKAAAPSTTRCIAPGCTSRPAPMGATKR